MENNENIPAQWEGPGDVLEGLMPSSSGTNDFTDIDYAFVEPEWAKRGEGIKAVAFVETVEQPAIETEFMMQPEPELASIQETYNTLNLASMIDVATKLKNTLDVKFNPIIDEPTLVKTIRTPIGDNVFGVFNTFNLTSQITNDIFEAANKFELLGITNLRVQGALMSYVKSVKLVCSMKVIDTVYDYTSWQPFRALFADNQSEPGRLPFSCMLGNRAIPQSPSTQWQILVQFDKTAQTMNRDDAYITFDLVQCSPTEFEAWTRPILYTHLCKPSEILAKLSVGVLVRGAELEQIKITRLDCDQKYDTTIVFGQKYDLGPWKWYPYGKALLCDLSSNVVLCNPSWNNDVETNLTENTGIVCICAGFLHFSLKAGLRLTNYVEPDHIGF